MATLGQLPEKAIAKACHNQQRYDTEKAYCYHHGDSAGGFHFMLDSLRQSWDLSLFSDLPSVLKRRDEDVGVGP